jgi:hypothetical protein
MEIESKTQIEAPDPLKQAAALSLATSNHEIGEHQHPVMGKAYDAGRTGVAPGLKENLDANF